MKEIENIEEYSKEELVGQFGQQILCGMTGIDNVVENPTAEYLQGWVDVFSKDDRVAIQAACRSQSVVDWLLGIK
jgi:antirestriction protein ArdC